MRNLLDDSPQSMVKEKEEVDVNEDKTLYQYFKKELYLYLIYDTMSYQLSAMPPPIAKALKVEEATYTYWPIAYLSDYWLLKKDLVMVNETVNELNLTLHFDTYSLNYFIIQKQFEEQHKMQSQWGLEQGDMDEMKRMFLETDPILLSVTMIVSVLHTVFEVLAFKNDISFWKSKDSMEGISVKSLYL